VKPTRKTRKPITDLTPSDMQTFLIWEYAIDEEDVEGQDESWVRPVAAVKVPAKAYSQIVASTFRTTGGQQFSGYMIISPAASTAKLLDHSGGALFHTSGQCFLIDLNGPALDFIKRDCLKEIESALKMAPAKAFPIGFELIVPISGEKQRRTGAFEAPKNA
jgi:hypothetical protein